MGINKVGPTRVAKVNIQRASQIAIPAMIPIFSGRARIMIEEVTVGLFRQVMEKYTIKGHNAEVLQAILADPKKDKEPLTYVSLLDAREFAKRLSKLTNRKFRVQTEKEWLAAGDQLQGSKWTWTETKYFSDDDNIYILRRRGCGQREGYYPLDSRIYNYAIRLVEDITA